MSSFVERYGGIYEHSPWIAERAEAHLQGEVTIDDIARVMADVLDNATTEQQLELIRAHPDLAGKAQLAGALTAESSDEQSSAGLDQCTAAEYEQFQSLNGDYKQKFGFPFVMAVRDSSRQEILRAFESRLHNTHAFEFEAALQEIHKIAALRLEALGK
jgi:OHCU decarboxylase